MSSHVIDVYETTTSASNNESLENNPSTRTETDTEMYIDYTDPKYELPTVPRAVISPRSDK